MKMNSKSFSTLADRFWKYVDKKDENECWNWIGSFGTTGYGQIHLNGKPIKAHRASWIVHNNVVLDSSQVLLHKCDNPACVNPDHLAIGTQQDNLKDMRQKERGSLPPEHLGENCHLHKLKENQVIEIIRSSETQTSLAKQFKVAQGTISSIKRGKTWKHVRATMN